MRIACLYLEAPVPQPETLRALAEACFRFSPQIALGERAVFLEVGACRRLFSEQRLMIGLGSLAKRFGFLSRITFGRSAGEALALARNPGFLEARALPLEGLPDYAYPFAAKSPADDPEGVKKLGELIQSLKILGLKSIGELATLPPRALASRFGKEAVKLGDEAIAWPGFHPSPRIIEEAPVESSETLEAILFVLRGLADRMVARLRGRGERVSRLAIRFDLVKWGIGHPGKRDLREFTLQLPLAQGSVAALIPILRDYLGGQLERVPLDAPVHSIRIEALETVPGSSAQRDFFSKKEEEAEAWDALVARLSQRLGQKAGKAMEKNRVFVAVPEKRYLPEKAYSRSMIRGESPRPREAEKFVADGPRFAPTQAPAWPPRPTRLLTQPRELGSLESVLRGRASLEGPERLSGEWWDSQYEGFNRDYYRLKTASGEELWVFLKRLKPVTSRSSPAGVAQEVLYLHGYFD